MEFFHTPPDVRPWNGFDCLSGTDEILDVVDERGEPTGTKVPRTLAHRLGIRHRTAHVWLLRRREGQVEILLQKRSREKDSYPGCYDISSAGHIPAGVGYIPSAMRELKEELGCEAHPEELCFCGQRRFAFRKEFHGLPFYDRQVSNVYSLWRDMEPEEFALQRSEVSEVRWFRFSECLRLVQENGIPHCIYLEELELIRQAVGISEE